jgi:hypothetical protein
MAQQSAKPDRPSRPQGMAPSGQVSPMAGAWVSRLLSIRENLEKIGVDDAEVLDKVGRELGKIKKSNYDLEKRIRILSREQAKLMRELANKEEVDDKELFAKIDELAKLRAEQGRLAVKSLLVLRSNLDEKQMKAAHKLVAKSAREKMAARKSAAKQQALKKDMADKPAKKECKAKKDKAAKKKAVVKVDCKVKEDKAEVKEAKPAKKECKAKKDKEAKKKAVVKVDCKVKEDKAEVKEAKPAKKECKAKKTAKKAKKKVDKKKAVKVEDSDAEEAKSADKE